MLTKNTGLFMAICIGSAGLTGCLSMSSLQTAEILPVGETTVEMGAGVYTSPSINDAINEASDSSSSVDDEEAKSIMIPYFEFGFRMGLTENYEMGARYTLPGAITVDGKYSLLNQEEFDVAVGLAVGYQSYEASSTSDSADSSEGSVETKSKATMLDVTIPLYTSYRINDSFAFYGTPKFILRNAKSESKTDAETTKSSSILRMAGLTVGTLINGYSKGKGIAFEITYAKDISSEFNVLQMGGAYLY